MSLGMRLFFSFAAVAALALALPLVFFPDRPMAQAPVALVLALAAAGTAGYLLSRRAARSIRETIRVAEAIGRGDYAKRLLVPRGGEFEALAASVNEMARGIEEHIRTITAQKSQLEAILNGMKEGVMVLDAEGNIRSVNNAFAQVFPGNGERVGRRPIEVVPCPRFQSACDAVLSGEGGAGPAMVRLEIEIGPDRFYDVSVVGLHRAGGELGAVAVFHDLSDFKRLDRARKDFAANVTHELRTPLTSVKGYAETLLQDKGGLSPDRVRFLEVILKNANHMSKMIEDMLCLARIEDSPMPAAPPRADALQAFVLARRECEAMAAEKRIAIKSRLPEEGVPVLADFGQLAQVFRNLLENSVKYSPAESFVTVSRHKDNGTVTFAVQDNGPGVPHEDRQRVFERFYRVERHRAKTAGGTGLGLAIAKHIVERHGGRIWVERARGEMSGAAFFFTLATPPSGESPAGEAREEARG
ncbi:HAMP domain-containing sensor histidine kinase [Desulfolutivibrio sulfoxidireducens]|uniref:HAMP domain-containing sensor histidine kinase n=1 Tax=Desulfolutivibrio sulfoxidireducens TaxID=2773299 RepID=UPI00159E344F|nr:HAMP domain-containing sensor histidine kinase [Desulfolutivibrio sulfoxidireducens]QLA17889.1 HAMP domain-containing protein [Desulfolutivibrio sulfoxidireducens]